MDREGRRSHARPIFCGRRPLPSGGQISAVEPAWGMLVEEPATGEPPYSPLQLDAPSR